jgi:hypothetical protein
MALILIGIEGFNGMNWLACLASGTCHGVLGVIFIVTRFPSERSGATRLCSAMM